MGRIGSVGQTLSFEQIRDLWIRNGGNPAQSYIAAAVALAESGGVTNNLNDNPGTGDYSVGLWQINYFGRLLPGRTSTFGSPLALAGSPDAQARAAIAISGNGTNWAAPWSTYRSGAYKRYLALNPPRGVLPLDTGNILANLQPAGTRSGATDAGAPGPASGGKSDFDPAWEVGPFHILTRSQARAVLGATIGAAGALLLVKAAMSATGTTTNVIGGAAGGAVAGSAAGPGGVAAGAAGGAARGAVPRKSRSGQGQRSVERGVAARQTSQRERRQAEDRMARDELAERRKRAASPEGKSRSAQAEGRRNAALAGPFPEEEVGS